MALTLNVADLQAHLTRSNARWRAEVTNLSHLSETQKLRRLGATHPQGRAGMATREAQSLEMATRTMATGIRGIASRWDWRNVNGQNYVTAVKDQGGCGSCVAFGSIATAETALRVEQQTPSLAIDLSEAQLFYCEGRAHGRNCDNGWWPDQALQCLANPGVADDPCFPYTPGDQNCNLCANWELRVTKVANFHKLSDHAAMKSWLSTHGALVTCFNVYDDFYSYRTGVYQHVLGDLAGGHCVSVIGYDDTAQCWICKNSWGSGWGDSGFFRIAYGQCGIDAEMWAVDGIVGPKVVLSDTSRYTPALADFANVLALAWTGTDSPSHLNIMTSSDGYHFGNKVILMDTSFDGPALAAGGTRLFIAWAGTDSKHHLNVMSSTNGRDFVNKVTLEEQAAFGPALAYGNNRLFLAWVGTDSHHSINILSSSDGVHWDYPTVTLSENSDSAVALCWIGNLLYLLWQGTDPGSRLNLLQSADGRNWGNKITLPDSSDYRAGLLQGTRHLILGWVGRDPHHSLNTMISTSGSHGFDNKITFEDNATAGVALSLHAGQPYICWAGTEFNHRLNVMRILN
jgi:C1A family cysteine protease